MEPICQNVRTDKFYSFVLGISISFVIVIMNTVLKIVVVEAIKFIGDDTISS